jgi:putative ABC transport system ATP-binding protein
MTSTSAVEVLGVTREYRRGAAVVYALRGVDLRVERGERVSIMGPSGCGKSTLLGLIGGLDKPTGGTVKVMGNELSRCTESDLTAIRRNCIGFVLQSNPLLPMLTARENIELPLALAGVEPALRRTRADELLAQMGLEAKAESLPEELSGGQQQRIGIARALANRPPLLLADEPSGNLDSATAREILVLLTDSAQVQSSSLIMVTHDPGDAAFTDRVVHLRDGLFVESEKSR